MLRPRFFTLLLLSLPLALGAACGKKSGDDRDFSTIVLNEGDLPWDRPTDCRKNIETATCVVSNSNRNCHDDAAPYVAKFQALYDQYPPVLQKMFCSLRHLYIEADLESTAYAQRLMQSNGRPAAGANVGFRKSILDAGLGFATWASWKEQLSFGGAGQNYLPSAALPSYMVSGGADGLDLFLYMVMAHEFGHLFDFANGVNKRDGATTWSSMSWNVDGTPNAAHAYAGRDKFCFYWCSSFASTAEANSLYDSLNATSFLTTYAGTNSYDDFAESTAYYFLSLELPHSVFLETRQGRIVPVSEKLDAAVFAGKLEFLRSFFSGSNLRYP